MKLFTKEKTAAPVAEMPGKPAVQLREERESAVGAAERLRSRLGAARIELNAAQNVYDADTQTHALGQTNVEPDRGPLTAAVVRVDALQRILTQQEKAIADLSAELADAELREALAAGRHALPQLEQAAKVQLDRFERALREARAAEAALFAILFGRDGLKQEFVGSIATDARIMRHGLQQRAVGIAEWGSFRIDDRFVADGDPYLGPELPLYEFRMVTANSGR